MSVILIRKYSKKTALVPRCITGACYHGIYNEVTVQSKWIYITGAVCRCDGAHYPAARRVFHAIRRVGAVQGLPGLVS